MLNFRTLLSGLFTASLLSSPALAQADWPMFQYDARRQGQVNRPAIRKPKVLWKTPIGVAGWLNNPVIADDMVFMGSAGQVWNQPDHGAYTEKVPTDGVYAFDLKTGKKRWYTPAKNDVNAVVYAQGMVIATGGEGAVWALDAQTGQEKWRVTLRGEGYQLLSYRDQIVLGDAQGELLWIDTQSGRVKHRAQVDGPVRSGLAADEQRIYAATLAGTLYAFSHNGDRIWERELLEFYPDLRQDNYALQLSVYGALTLHGDAVIAGFARDSYYESPALVALKRQDGNLKWKSAAYASKSDWGNIRSSPALFQDLLIYAEPYSNAVVALDATDGKAKGGQFVGAPMFPQWSSPAIAGKTAYVPRFDGGLYAIDASDGSKIWEFYLGIPNLAGPNLPAALKNMSSAQWKPPIGDAIYASPALTQDGRILIPAAGYLYCIGEEK